MISDYQSRHFQLWEYRVGHGSLLIRSPRGEAASQNVDLVFVGVEYLAIPRHLKGILIEKASDADRAAAREAIGDFDSGSVFVLVSDGRRHLVVATALRISENDDDLFDSPF